jgi:sarcosine oxidase subunit alpha
MSARVLRAAQGGRIDRSKPMRFRFDGKTYQGCAGDTLASALVANGVRVAGRSFKYHRPRGLLAAGVEEPNVLVQLEGDGTSTPNLRATEIELFDGLVARPVNCWPSAGFDLGAVNSLVGRFLPAGFYYKTFMWPNWRLFEAPIRKAAGLGKAPDEPDPSTYDERYAHCDVLVVGGGAAGLVAAHAAAAQGARVILCEQDRELGGRLLWDAAEVEGMAGPDWVSQVSGELEAAAEVRILTRTTVAGYFDHNELVAVQAPVSGARLRLWQIRARRVVLATGALERPLVFPGNDRPGVMLATAAQQYLVRYGALPGRQVVVFANNDDAYEPARRLAEAGVLAAVIDSRPGRAAPAWLDERGAEFFSGAEVAATFGDPAISGVEVRSASGARRRLRCDALAVSGGFNPSIHLHCQSGGKPRYDEARAMFLPGDPVQAEASVGATAGQLALADAVAAAHEAGLAAARATGHSGADVSAPKAVGRPAPAISPLWRVNAPGKAFVDFQNDVAVSDIELAARENFVSVEHMKRYTTLGMAPDQGKTSNVNALAIMAGLTERSIAETGTTRYRFPFTPIALGAFAAGRRGKLLRPLRRMPAHDRHEAAGAMLEDYGGYLRPVAYRRAGEEEHAAVLREARAVRERAGLFEGSPLGKIEVVGPDAGEFLDRIYANTMSTLKVGRVRYGLMLNELGVIIDDGVTARLGEQRFLVGTTGSGADRIAGWLEEWRQCEWPDLQVIIAPITTAWGVITLTGPKATEILRAAACDIDLDPAAFPHMSFREGVVDGIRARVFRVSFTGEVSYEINVAAGRTGELWDKIMAAGAPHGLEPVGVEAWMLLRTEKGYIHVGADTDGSTSPDDIGWGHVLKREKDFVGRRSLTRPDNVRPDRFQLVGLEVVGSDEALPVGVHVRGRTVRSGSEGYVTSAGFSPVLGRGVALGMVRGGRARMGEELEVLSEGGPRKARIIRPGVYDPEGARLNA